MVVGAGTVLTVEQARAAAGAGAAFAVAPGTDDDVVAACGELGLPFFPGIATPSELGHALRLGCTTVKVFPAADARRPGVPPRRLRDASHRRGSCRPAGSTPTLSARTSPSLP